MLWDLHTRRYAWIIGNFSSRDSLRDKFSNLSWRIDNYTVKIEYSATKLCHSKNRNAALSKIIIRLCCDVEISSGRKDGFFCNLSITINLEYTKIFKNYNTIFIKEKKYDEINKTKKLTIIVRRTEEHRCFQRISNPIPRRRSRKMQDTDFKLLIFSKTIDLFEFPRIALQNVYIWT